MELYDIIKNMAHSLGFADFGCAKAEQLPEEICSRYLEALNEGRFAGMQYLGKNIEKRFNPTLLVKGAASVLVFLAPYSLPDNITPPAGIAQYALGKDYHQVIKGKLFAIMEKLKEIVPDFAGRAFTDSAPVLEREWGVRAGLGFIGRNNFLISKRCGIKNFIGIIISNLNIPATEVYEPQKFIEAKGNCGHCTRCLNACPTGALKGEYCMDSGKCISYHTIENRNLSDDIEKGIVPDLHGNFFGCDSCLDVCPWNKKNLPGWGDFSTNLVTVGNKGSDWWEMLSPEEFNSIFKETPLLRGGLTNIQESIKWNKKKGYNG